MTAKADTGATGVRPRRLRLLARARSWRGQPTARAATALCVGAGDVAGALWTLTTRPGRVAARWSESRQPRYWLKGFQSAGLAVSMKSKNIDYLPGVDHLRGFAALLIVAYHGVTVITYKLAYGDPFTFDHWGDADNPLTALVLEGHTAVALFMVLSGFIFAYGSYGKDVQYKDFIINRFVRTYPLFLVILFLGMAARPEGVTLDGVLQSVLFLANTRAAVDLTPYTSMFWAVAVEWQFYLIFPFLLAFLNQRGVRPLLLLLVALILLRTLATALGASPRDISYWTIIGRMDQFLLGMLGGAAFQRGLIGGGRAMALVAGSGALVLAYAAALNAAGGWPRDMWWKSSRRRRKARSGCASFWVMSPSPDVGRARRHAQAKRSGRSATRFTSPISS